MKIKFKSSLERAWVVAAAALSLVGFNALALTRAALPGATSADIRDIRGPKHIPSPWLWAVWLTGGLVLGALCYAIWRWSRRRGRALAKLPYQIALEQLEQARALMQPENAREFSINVSEIVRHYIEQRFHVGAGRRTTEEFLYDLLDSPDALLTGHRELLGDFLHHCDLAKFARWILSVEEMESMLQSARAFVIETGPPSTPTGTPQIAPATVEQGQQV